MAGGVIERFHAANSDFAEWFYGVCGGKEAGRGRADRYGGCMGLSENISDHILCCICDEQTGVYQCRDSVGIYAEYDYERRPGAGKPSGIYQR